jgi:ParB family chromosome partitioning protein
LGKDKAVMKLTDFDSIFQENRNADSGECVVMMDLEKLYPPEFHPFQVLDDAAMERLVKSIKRYGVREPGLVREREGGGYELVSGNRRKRACELAGLAVMPVIIRDMSDDDAAIAMVDANLEQREQLLPSEKAWAYRVKLEALNHSGRKGEGLSVEILVEQTGESKNQIFRLVRLTELVPELMDKVDAKQLAFNPAVELSYLKRTEQIIVYRAMEKFAIKPSLSQSQKLKQISQEGDLDEITVEGILKTEKKPVGKEVKLKGIQEFFPSDYSQRQMEAVIRGLLKNWVQKRAVSLPTP